MARRKQITKHAHHKRFFAGGVASFFLTGLALGGVYLLNVSHDGAFASKVHVFSAGQTISNAYYDVRIDQASRSAGNSHGLKPHDGKEFLVVNLFVKNKSSRSTEVFPATQSYIKDSSGQTYNLGVSETSQQFQAGDLAPGDQVKGNVVYEIPKGLKNPLFYLEGLADKPLIVKLP